MTVWQKRPGSRWSRGSTRAYREARAASLAAHLARRGGCELAVSDRCTGKAEEWHHTRARELVGDDPAYMVWSCRPCNLKVGDPTKGDPQPDPGTRW